MTNSTAREPFPLPQSIHPYSRGPSHYIALVTNDGGEAARIKTEDHVTGLHFANALALAWNTRASTDAVAVAWRPIESAPKDGTTIDVWRDGSRETVYWGFPPHECGEMGQYCDSDWHSLKQPGWICSTFGEYVGGKHDPFTHWKPLDKGPLAHPPVADAAVAGEDRYLAGYSEGSSTASKQHVWMQDKAWQDAVLMLVHYRALAARTWLHGHEDAQTKLDEWWKRAAALAETKTAEEIAALSHPAPAEPAQEYAFAVGRLCNLLARFEEIKDWVEDDIGTAWNCDRCGYSTYHANATECADCGEEMPFAHIVAFKLGARATDNREAIELMADELGIEGLALEYALANPQRHPVPALSTLTRTDEASVRREGV